MNNLSDIIVDTARRNGVPYKLLAAMAWHESVKAVPGNDIVIAQYATRYEPKFYERYIVPMLSKLKAGEAYGRATSWGYCQIMGQVARELGFAGPFLAQLTDPKTNFEYGARKLARCFGVTRGDTELALLRYNGGGNKEYPGKVLAVLDSKEWQGFFSSSQFSPSPSLDE